MGSVYISTYSLLLNCPNNHHYMYIRLSRPYSDFWGLPRTLSLPFDILPVCSLSWLTSTEKSKLLLWMGGFGRMGLQVSLTAGFPSRHGIPYTCSLPPINHKDTLVLARNWAINHLVYCTVLHHSLKLCQIIVWRSLAHYLYLTLIEL